MRLNVAPVTLLGPVSGSPKCRSVRPKRYLASPLEPITTTALAACRIRGKSKRARLVISTARMAPGAKRAGSMESGPAPDGASRNDDRRGRRLNRPSRIRHRRGEAAIDGERLAVNVGRLVAREEQRHRRDLVRLAGALQGIELADLVGSTALLGAVEHRLGHAGLDQARAYRVDAHAGAGKRIGGGLHQADDAGLARGIGMA